STRAPPLQLVFDRSQWRNAPPSRGTAYEQPIVPGRPILEAEPSGQAGPRRKRGQQIEAPIGSRDPRAPRAGKPSGDGSVCGNRAKNAFPQAHASVMSGLSGPLPSVRVSNRPVQNGRTGTAPARRDTHSCSLSGGGLRPLYNAPQGASSG